MSENVIQPIYLVSAVLFILSLMWMNHPRTARRGIVSGVVAMVAAIGGTLLLGEVKSYQWIAVTLVVGTALGVPLAMVPLTAVPQRTALSHAFGGLAAGLVGVAEYYLWSPRHALGQARHTAFGVGALVTEVILGFLTFTGSLMAAGKLQEWIPTRPITYKGQNAINLSLLGVAILAGVWLVRLPTHWLLLPLIVLISLAFGVLLIIPIGGADMPTVIALLNSYAGLSAVAMGFVLNNKLLIAAGALDGSSGLILSIIMCRAMNRSFANVLFGAFGQVQVAAGAVEKRPVKSATAEDAAQITGGRPHRRHRARLRHGGGAGTAPGPRAVRRADQARGGGEVRRPSGGRPHARPHERAAGRGRDPLRSPDRDGGHQSGDGRGRRGADRRRQRRGQSGGAARQVEPDLRHADHRRRPGQDRVRHQAEHEPRLRRHRERAVLRRQHADALRRRQGDAHQRRAGAEGLRGLSHG